MTAEAPKDVPEPPVMSAEDLSPEDLTNLLVASGMMPTPTPTPASSRRSLRRKLLIASLIAAIGLGASVMSCVGQSFSYRQAHALEGIEKQLKEIREHCKRELP